MENFIVFNSICVYLNLENQSVKKFKILSLNSLSSTFFSNAEQILTNLDFSWGICFRFSFNLIVSNL